MTYSLPFLADYIEHMNDSTLHVHLGERHCLEVSVLRGSGHDVMHLGDELLATKGVLHGEITFTSGEGALNKLG